MARLTDPLARERPVPRQVGGIVKLPVEPQNDAIARGVFSLGQNLEAGTEEIYRAQKIEQEKADTTRVEDAWNQYKQSALDATLGEGGVLRLQGGEAVNGNILEVARRLHLPRMATFVERMSAA